MFFKSQHCSTSISFQYLSLIYDGKHGFYDSVKQTLVNIQRPNAGEIEPKRYKTNISTDFFHVSQNFSHEFAVSYSWNWLQTDTHFSRLILIKRATYWRNVWCICSRISLICFTRLLCCKAQEGQLSLAHHLCLYRLSLEIGTVPHWKKNV